ncbi:laminin-like protein, partial [Acrasis kona]
MSEEVKPTEQITTEPEQTETKPDGEVAVEQKTESKRGRGPRGRGYSKDSKDSKDRDNAVGKDSRKESGESSEGKKREPQKKRREQTKREFESVEELEKKISELEVVAEPDINAVHKKTDEIYKKIEEAQDKLAKNRQKMDEQNRSSSKHEGRRQELYDLVNDHTSKLKAKIREKDNIQLSLTQLEQERDEHRRKQDSIKKDLQYTRIEDVEKKIASLEGTLSSETHDRRTENSLVTQIRKLRANKEVLSKLTNVKDNTENNDNKITELRSLSKNLQKSVEELVGSKNKLSEELNEINIKTDNTDRKKFQENNSALRETITKLYESADKIRADAKVHSQKYRVYEKELSDLKYRLDYQKNQEKRQKEYEARKEKQALFQKQQEERNKKWAEEEAEYKELEKLTLYDNEIKMCDSLIAYLEKVQKTNAQKLAKLNQSKQIVSGDITSLRNKAKKDQNLQKKQQQQLTVNHPIDNFRNFSSLGLEAPLYVSKIDASIQALRKKRRDYKDAQSHAQSGKGLSYDTFGEVKEITTVTSD